MSTVPDFLLSHRGRRRARRGLTLIEVVVGLAILSLMAGAIYAIVSGAVTSSATLALTQKEDRRVEAFLNRVRKSLRSLPAAATLELRVLENDPLRQEFVFTGVPEAFAWGNNQRWDKQLVTLCPMEWEESRLPPPAAADTRGKPETPPSRRYSLSMTAPDFFRLDNDGEPLPDSPVKSRSGTQFLKPDRQGRFWLELLPEVDRVEWRFYDAAKKIWIEKSPPVRPPMVELRLFLPGRVNPLRAVFATT